MCVLPGISGMCRQSFATICDNFEDYHQILEKVTELIIGSENSDSYRMTSANNDKIRLSEMINLKGALILGKINNLESNAFTTVPYNFPLDYLKFYGNDIKRLRPDSFRLLEVRRFSFVNNNLEVLQKNAFYRSTILTLDLSYNKLEEIEDDVLSDKALGRGILRKTEELIITHNRLRVIYPKSLPSSLRILNLDYNNLNVLENIFDDLSDLQKLTVSHNNVYSIPKLKHLQSLIYLDFSYNKISFLQIRYFEDLPMLRNLNLNYNQIHNPDVLDVFRQVSSESFVPEINLHLAYNNLTHLSRSQPLQLNHNIIMYGNPWLCKWWPKVQELIPGRDACDLQYFGNGYAPYCVDLAVTSNFAEERAYLRFLSLRHNAKASCSLEPKQPLIHVF